MPFLTLHGLQFQNVTLLVSLLSSVFRVSKDCYCFWTLSKFLTVFHDESCLVSIFWAAFGIVKILIRIRSLRSVSWLQRSGSSSGSFPKLKASTEGVWSGSNSGTESVKTNYNRSKCGRPNIRNSYWSVRLFR
jgi:hypothetical protein